ncbi:MAG: heme NO-binding domain-containing protein [Maricaulis sp.]|nr:heme NO-binding domain-containing protein [Maricaulis sp.]MDG2045435.1 heme NO-binding domain-containing protein [Maricaulis sp.]
MAGEDDWSAIVSKSGLSERHFVSGLSSDDETTFALIGAIQEHTKIPLDELLKSFGEYWIKYASETSYGGMMKMAGNDLVSLLSNLDRMHVGIAAQMPGASMPSFEVLDASDTQIKIRYRSERDGLEAFVVGLLQGLLNRFNDFGEIRYIINADFSDFTIVRSVEKVPA